MRSFLVVGEMNMTILLARGSIQTHVVGTSISNLAALPQFAPSVLSMCYQQSCDFSLVGPLVCPASLRQRLAPLCQWRVWTAAYLDGSARVDGSALVDQSVILIAFGAACACVRMRVCV